MLTPLRHRVWTVVSSYIRTATTSPDTAVSARRPRRRRAAEQVGDDPGQQAPDGEAAVAPEPVDADRAGPPGRVGDVADRGEQRRVDHRGAGAEQDRRDRPERERSASRDQRQRGGLDQHPVAISHLRPQRSDSAPVTSCPTPHTAG